MSEIVTAPIPITWANEKDHRERMASAVNQILKGKTNNVGTVILTANTTTTTITDTRIGNNSVILLQPTTANAATALTTTYPGTPGSGSVVLNHANNAQTDRAFLYIVVG